MNQTQVSRNSWISRSLLNPPGSRQRLCALRNQTQRRGLTLIACGVLMLMPWTPVRGQQTVEPIPTSVFELLEDESELMQTGFSLSDIDDLDSLTDQQLIDLYITESQDSLRRQALDETRLAAPGSVILQAGYTFTRDEDDLDFSYRTHTFPDMLLRYRIGRRVELRVGWAGATYETVTDELTGVSDSFNSWADPSIGGRFLLSEQDGWCPRTALTASTPVELRSTTNLASRFNPLTAFSYSWLCEDRWIVSGSSGIAWTTNGTGRFVDFQQVASVDYLINDRWNLGMEWFGLFPDSSGGGGTRHFAGPGLSCAVNDRLQVGVTTSFGLNDASSDFMSQLQITWRP